MDKIILMQFTGRGGQERYHCPDCPFDHYDPGVLVKHHHDLHKPEAAPMGPTLFGPDDKKLTPDSQEETEVTILGGKRIPDFSASTGRGTIDSEKLPPDGDRKDRGEREKSSDHSGREHADISRAEGRRRTGKKNSLAKPS